MEVAPKDVLVISYIGYLDTKVPIAGQKQIHVVLSEDNKMLDEVVVIGYGTTSTRKMASAVTAVKGEKLQDLPFNSVAASLAGRATGVIVQSSGGEPGSAPSISIRGGGAPVYVIDGVISDAWDFNTLNPNDIESLSILKDAASLAVYGSRAANGIVMVKTKQGGKGKTAVNYTFNAEFSQPTKLLKRLVVMTMLTTKCLPVSMMVWTRQIYLLIRKYWISLKISQILIHPDTPIQIGWEKD